MFDDADFHDYEEPARACPKCGGKGESYRCGAWADCDGCHGSGWVGDVLPGGEGRGLRVPLLDVARVK